MSFVTTDDGVRLWYQLEGSAAAPMLVLSNSLGTDLTMWDGQMPALLRHFQVLRYDARGHGQSSVPPGAYLVDRLGRDVIALLDACGVARAHFLRPVDGRHDRDVARPRGARPDRPAGAVQHRSAHRAGRGLGQARRDGARRRHDGDHPGGHRALVHRTVPGPRSGRGRAHRRHAARHAGRRLLRRLPGDPRHGPARAARRDPRPHPGDRRRLGPGDVARRGAAWSPTGFPAPAMSSSPPRICPTSRPPTISPPPCSAC